MELQVGTLLWRRLRRSTRTPHADDLLSQGSCLEGVERNTELFHSMHPRDSCTTKTRQARLRSNGGWTRGRTRRGGVCAPLRFCFARGVLSFFSFSCTVSTWADNWWMPRCFDRLSVILLVCYSASDLLMPVDQVSRVDRFPRSQGVF